MISHFTKGIKDWANERYGIVIPAHQIEQIEQRVDELILAAGLDKNSYLRALEANDESIVRATIHALTVHESYFFRDENLFSFLKNTLLPELIKERRKKGNYQFNIWSVGCSYGEEIYSIAICLEQLLPDIKQWKINLLGTDIDCFAIEKAKKAGFTTASVRTLDEEIKRDYFQFKFPLYFLNGKIRNMVKFEYDNIAKMKVTHVNYDLIFCRNVFIYLDRNTVAYALDFFYKNLVDDGRLFLAPSDFFIRCPHKFSTQITKDLCFFKKDIDQKRSTHKEIVKKEIVTDDKKKETALVAYSKIQPERTKSLHTIRSMLDEKNYRDALKNIDSHVEKYGGAALLYRYKGEALIHLGEMATAHRYLTKAIKLDPFDAISYFFKGLIEMDIKNSGDAIVSLQKALSVKSNFPEAAYYLGLFYLQNKQQKLGIELLERALAGAKELPKEKNLYYVNESIEQFTRTITASISHYQEARQ